MPHWPTTPQIEPGPVLSCMECGEYTPVPEDECEPFEPCPQCGADVTTAADASLCPDPATCQDDEHHFRLCVHITEREDG